MRMTECFDHSFFLVVFVFHKLLFIWDIFLRHFFILVILDN
jgi:hypothetical protein